MNSRMRGLLLITIVAALALAGSAGAQNPTLFGDGRPRLLDPARRRRRHPRHAHPDPGTYTIQVNDLATAHNFHLTGPGSST